MVVNKCESILNCDKLTKLFDGVRVVNPVEKIVIKDKNINSSHCAMCYHLWSKDSMCENCISIRAYNENASFIKIEYEGEKVYLVMAAPVVIENERYVMETMRDITDYKILVDKHYTTAEEINERIKEINLLVVTDELTKCFNRRYINEKLPLDMKLAREMDMNLIIAMLDIDYFKSINDKYSHIAGDNILRQVIDVIKSNIRSEYDWIARYGGEEFLIVLNNTSDEKAFNLLNRVRSTIENTTFKYEKYEINLTISIGIATLSEDIKEPIDFIKKADENLYKAKKRGRNLVC